MFNSLNWPVSKMDCKVSQAIPLQKISSASTSIKNSRKLLWYAVSRGNLKLVDRLLKSDFRVEDALDHNCGHPIRLVFCRAISKPRVELLRLLINHGLEVNSLRNRSEESLLHQFVRHFTEQSDSDAVDIAETLVQSGVPVDEPDNQGYTPLHWATLRKHPRLVEFLLGKGADVNRKSGPRASFPLIVAARNCNEDIVSLLLNKGAEIDAKDGYGCTALHAACGRRHKEIIALLVDKGADSGALEKNGKTPFDLLEF